MEDKALGLVETWQVVAGILAADAMLKRAEVTLISARYVCVGKFMVLVRGNTSSVRQAVDAGAEIARDQLAGKFIIRNIHPAVLEVMDRRIPVPVDDPGNSLGLIETKNVAACIVAADMAVKTADVTLLELRLANRLGGKSYVLMWGQVGAVEAAVAAGADTVPEDVLVQQAVIPSLHPDLKSVITKALAAEA